MKKIGIVRCMIVGALVSAYVGSAAAQAINEIEPNYPAAQPVAFGADGRVVVNGVIGVMFGPAMSDQDLFSFYARKGDVLDVDIDNGIKIPGTPGRSVQTILTVLGPGPAYRVRRQSTIVPFSDPHIELFKVPEDGIYIVGVTGNAQTLGDGGVVQGFISSFNGNGNYTLIISMTSSPVLPISIEVKPGSGEFAPINLKARGSIPVALLTDDDFDALKADRGSITFGATGDEHSLRRCGWEGEDVNGDTRLDLVCHFENQKTGFGPDHLEGVLKGTIDGKPFEGRGALKVLPAKPAK